ncbi:hypothetical protein [Allorhizocola rhizosphaerae]|uniref:hypothetical protein n=1 Tax=Allorhizocola rhizosphaerae TaxID=1872709 RepID=UPI000E3CEB25|nr:hypothetical protein [Allorhizocola rhizosphaerae]
MADVVILSLVEGDACGTRVPVLRCVDALSSMGAKALPVVAGSDAAIDEALSRLPDVRLVIAAESTAQLRHVLRRMVRRYAPPPSKRPSDFPINRTVSDLPTVGVLPLAPLAFELPGDPDTVAKAVLGSTVTKLDLLRHDGGSVTIDGVLVGAASESGTPLAWRGRIDVDDTTLSDGTEPIIALSVANAGGTAQLDGLPLVTAPNPADGLIDVAVAIPVSHKPFLGKARLRYEVRRAQGRAVAVTPRDPDLPFLDDGVAGVLNRKRSWWIEPSAWSVYTS